MNIFDIIIIIIILGCGFVGFKMGFIKSLVSFVGIILVFLLSMLFKNPIAEWLSLNLPFFSFWGDFKDVTVINVIIYQLISFVICFSILMAIYGIVVKVSGIFEKILKLTFIMAIPSKVFGFILGLLEGVIISVALMIFLSVPIFNIESLHESSIRNFIFDHSVLAGNLTQDTTNSIQEIMDLKDKFGDDTDRGELNLSCFDVLLKYKVITVDYSKKLVDSGKLKVDENKANEIISKYEKEN